MSAMQKQIASKKTQIAIVICLCLSLVVIYRFFLPSPSSRGSQVAEKERTADSREVGDGFVATEAEGSTKVEGNEDPESVKDTPRSTSAHSKAQLLLEDRTSELSDGFSNVVQNEKQPKKSSTDEEASDSSSKTKADDGLEAISRKLQEINKLKGEVESLATKHHVVISEYIPTERRNLGDETVMYVSGDSSLGTVWGNGPYTTDSNIRGAAIHAGAIGSEESGFVRVVMVQPPVAFTGSNRNGVTTYAYSEFPTAFNVFPLSAKVENNGEKKPEEMAQAAPSTKKTISWIRESSWQQYDTLFSGLDPTGTLLACAYTDGIQYRDSVTGILRGFYPQLSSKGGCLSASADKLYLYKGVWRETKDDSTVVKIDCVEFGDSHPSSSIFLPCTSSSDEIEQLESSSDGKYLFVKFENRLLLYNLQEKSTELTLDAPRLGYGNYAVAYQPELGLLVFLHGGTQDQYVRTLVDVRTGLKTTAKVVNSRGESTRAAYLWIGKDLFEIQENELWQIDYKDRNKSTIIAINNIFNDDLWFAVTSRAANGGIWYNTDRDHQKVALYSLPNGGTAEKFLEDVKYFSSGRWGEKRNLFTPLPGTDSSLTHKLCLVSQDSKFVLLRVGREWQVWRQLDEESESAPLMSKSREDCRLLANLWSLGFADKTVEFFTIRGSVRRELWNEEYQKGDPHAACLLGLSLITGGGGTKSDTKGKALLNEAVEQDCLEAVVWQGAFGGDPEKTFAQLVKAEDSKDPFILESLANCYRNGLGCQKNDVEAFRLSLMASNLEEGDASALSVGKAYEQGIGTEKDPIKAFEMYKKALDAHALGAGFYVGMCYLNGTGTTQSSEEAFKWLEAESQLPGPLGKYGLGLCYERGVGCEKDVVRANELFEQCSQLGMTSAEAAFERTKKAADEIRSERSVDFFRRYVGRSYGSYRPSRSFSSASAVDTMGVMDDARAAVREWQGNVAGQLGVNGAIFTDSP
jgi:TPR repeat protein